MSTQIAFDSLLFGGASGDQLDLLATQLDLEFVAGLEVKHGAVGLTDEQVAVALHGGGVAQLATTFAAAYSIIAKA